MIYSLLESSALTPPQPNASVEEKSKTPHISAVDPTLSGVEIVGNQCFGSSYSRS